MPFDCLHRRLHGADSCLDSCPTLVDPPVFRFARVERGSVVPPPDPAIVDVAVLDMHHGWPNLGHDAIVHGVQNIVCDLAPPLRAAGLAVRVISYDVRRGLCVPPPPGGRHAIYLGTGGPGHLDPSLNDGVTPGSQGIREDPAWETPLFALFDAIRADERASLLAVCHTFGVMCRWLGVADAVLRGGEKGGKSSGIVRNTLTDEAVAHPWFSALARGLPDGRRLWILDNRLYDLVTRSGGWPEGVVPLSREAPVPGGGAASLTGLELARDREGVMPRILGVNHHPEIVNRARQLTILRRRVERGSVTEAWVEERARTLSETIGDEGDRLLAMTSSYMLFGPLRFFLYREIRLRAGSRGIDIDVDERRNALVEPEQG